MHESEPPNASRTSLTELMALFFRLGATAFGGPAAHIAMMHEEVVARRKWLTEERFLDLVGATNIIPGPSSTELAIHIGFERRRFVGLMVAGLSFILPAMLITGVIGWAYVRYGALPETGWLLYGVKPVILGIVLQAIWGLVPKAAKSTLLRVLGALALAASAYGINELIVLFGAGAIAMIASGRARSPGKTSASAYPLIIPTAGVAGASSLVSLPSLFWVFVKTGALLFGSGYVLLAFLRADLVERLGWMTEAQLIDAIAVGQVTPGPVFTTATFIGYVLAGPKGALVATLGIFLPSFFFVALSGPLVPRIRSSKYAGAFLDGVNVSSVALMIVVTAQLARAALIDWPTIAMALTAAVVLVRFKMNSTWLVFGGALAGFLSHRLGWV